MTGSYRENKRQKLDPEAGSDVEPTLPVFSIPVLTRRLDEQERFEERIQKLRKKRSRSPTQLSTVETEKDEDDYESDLESDTNDSTEKKISTCSIWCSPNRRRGLLCGAVALLLLLIICVFVDTAVQDNVPEYTTDSPTGAPTEVWHQVGDDLEGIAVSDYMGGAIALSANGKVLAAGSRTGGGVVRVFGLLDDQHKEDGGNEMEWKQLGPNLLGEYDRDRFGASVALSANGSILAVGAIWNHGGTGSWFQGHVRVLEYDNDTDDWKQLGHDLEGAASGDSFGGSVSLSADGTVLAVGATMNDGESSSRVFDSGTVSTFKFDRLSGRWLPMGQDIDGETESDMFGASVALSSDGKTLASGAIMLERNGPGYVRVLGYDDSMKRWIQRGQNLHGKGAENRFGGAVALSADGNTLAVGASKNDGDTGMDSGCVRVFEYDKHSDRWELSGQELYGEEAGDEFGESVALSADGRTVAAGAKWNDGRNGINSGHARVYKFNSSTKQWDQFGRDLDGEASTDLLGESVALSADGSVVAAGAAFNDGNGNRSGHVVVFKTHQEN